MPDRKPAIISAILTVILLVGCGVVFLFVQMVALNGVSERQGMAAMGLALSCQGISALLAGIFAGWFSNRVIAKFKWNKILAAASAVALGVLFGGALALIASIVSIPLVGIR